MSETLSDEVIDERVMDILATAIGELGGATSMVNHGDQEILPALVESAYALVMREEAGYSITAIADFLGISPGAVESVFEAPMEAHLARIHHREDKQPEFDRHTDPAWNGRPATDRQEPEFLAGSVAKFAYDVVNRRRTRPH